MHLVTVGQPDFVVVPDYVAPEYDFRHFRSVTREQLMQTADFETDLRWSVVTSLQGGKRLATLKLYDPESKTYPVRMAVDHLPEGPLRDEFVDQLKHVTRFLIEEKGLPPIHSTITNAYNFILQGHAGHFPGWQEKLPLFQTTCNYMGFRKTKFLAGRGRGADHVTSANVHTLTRTFYAVSLRGDHFKFPIEGFKKGASTFSPLQLLLTCECSLVPPPVDMPRFPKAWEMKLPAEYKRRLEKLSPGEEMDGLTKEEHGMFRVWMGSLPECCSC